MKEAVVASLSDEFSPHETCDRSGLLLLDALLCPGVLWCVVASRLSKWENEFDAQFMVCYR